MTSASKTTYSHCNLKILRPKVRKNLTNLRKKFCESLPWQDEKRLELSLIRDLIITHLVKKYLLTNAVTEMLHSLVKVRGR